MKNQDPLLTELREAAAVGAHATAELHARAAQEILELRALALRLYEALTEPAAVLVDGRVFPNEVSDYERACAAYERYAGEWYRSGLSG